MQSSKLGLQKWVIAIYMMTTGLKGTSSMKLHRELGRPGYRMAPMQRIREAFSEGAAEAKMTGPVEVDETYLGGKERNKHADQKLHQGRGTVGKSVVAGVKDRTTKQIARPWYPGPPSASCRPSCTTGSPRRPTCSPTT